MYSQTLSGGFEANGHCGSLDDRSRGGGVVLHTPLLLPLSDGANLAEGDASYGFSEECGCFMNTWFDDQI